jgi:hypothetical protein
MTPGPTEPSGEQLQHYLKIAIDDLLDLYDNGMLYKTAKFPEGKFITILYTF